MIRESLSKLVEKQDLSAEEMRVSMGEIMQGEATGAQIAAFITALRIKGETVAEISAAAEVMREKAAGVDIASEGLLDTCGTGGDGAQTFNISTTTAFVAAGAGARIAKHGNRSVSSRSGSADLLEALGVKLDIPSDSAVKAIVEIGIGFLFAPLLHPAMKHAIGPRKEMGIRTIFNILGPLSHPAEVDHYLLGVYSASLLETFARVLQKLGCVHALIVHGSDGLDEITLTGSSMVAELKDNTISKYELHPNQFGLDCCDAAALKGGNPMENAQITRDILDGKKGAHRDICLLNAGAAIYAADLSPNISAGIEAASEAIDSGRAKAKLEALIEITHRP